MRLLKRLLILKKDYNGFSQNIKPYINHRTFKTSYRIYVFGTRYQNDRIGPQPIQPKFKFSVAVADVICHALVLTRKVVRVNSDVIKMVDILSSLYNQCYKYCYSHFYSQCHSSSSSHCYSHCQCYSSRSSLSSKLFPTCLNKTFSINNN